MVDLFQKAKDKFPYLSEDKAIEMIGDGEIIMLNEGDVFVKAGDRTQKAALVIEGMMRNYIVNDNGEEITVVFASEMQVIGPYSAIFLGKPASETSVAVEPSTLLVLDVQKFRSKIQSDLLYARLYSEFIETAFVAAIERIEDFTQKKPEQRYQRLLDVHGFLIERVPLKYIASYLGITPVSLSRIRKRVARIRN